MRSTADHRDRGGERGAVLLFTAFAMFGLLTLTALITDMGLLRVMRRSNQNLVDMAALAAGPALAADTGIDSRSACTDAVRYLRLNADELSTLGMPCSSLPATCDPLNPAPVALTKTQGSYTVTITYPVSDAMITDPNTSNGRRTDDGEPCERLMVGVERVESTVFGTIVGRSELRTSSSAVVRQTAVQNRRVPSLWLLDPTGCNSMSVTGGAQVTVGTSTMPGLISLDSTGSTCTGNSFTIDVSGIGSSLQSIPSGTDPPAMISLVAMHPGQRTCAEGNLRACDPSDLANGTLKPQPVRRPWRATRAPIDHRFNCKPAYPNYLGTIPIQGCEDTTAPYIDQLRAGVGTVTGIVPGGFQRWTDFHPCAPSGVISVTGNWVVNCSDFKITNSSTSVTFAGGNVVFDGAITMTNGTLNLNTANPQANLPASCTAAITGCLTQSSSRASWAFMRSGSINLTGGALNAIRTMVYQENGNFKMTGGTPPKWSSPDEGPFAGLSVWSERQDVFTISGGSAMNLEGVFFTPRAKPFKLTGGGGLTPQKAQFISFAAELSGQGQLVLAPNSTHAITLPAFPVSLIR